MSQTSNGGSDSISLICDGKGHGIGREVNQEALTTENDNRDGSDESTRGIAVMASMAQLYQIPKQDPLLKVQV